MVEIVSAFITLLCEKLISADLMELARSEGIDTQLKKWEKTLPLIHSILADACNKQITDGSVQLWVNDLHDLVYDIDDLLDDLATEDMRRKLDQESHARTSKDLKLFTNTNFAPHNSRQKMSSKVDEITIKLDTVVERKNDVGLNVNVEVSNRRGRRLEEISLVDELQIIGREGDKEALLSKLLGSDENVGIVSIVGMAGIGKTTLAKVLYNEEKLKDHFEFRAWVSVTEECDLFNTSKSILEALSGEDERYDSLDLLHVALKEKLSKKRFLLVLDDVWNIDYLLWKLLGSPPLVGAPGSKVIVTTRRTEVASVMGSNETYHLQVLSNKDALSLFAQHALGEKNFDKHPTLQLHGEAIVNKCGGLPLALRMLGRVLKTSKNGYEWKKLKSEIWDIKDPRGILTTLKLRYYRLPQHLKRLFAYCSFFPRGYVFDKKTLVLMWMAEGFLSQSIGDKSMESLGHDYFQELKSRSFFQYSTNDDVGHTMHYLLGDLATSVAGEFFFRSDDEMDVSNTNETFEKLRHFSLIALQGESYKKLIKELQRSKRLRTFLLMSSGWKSNDLLDNFLVELLPDLQFLRVLSLSSWNITKIPQSIGNLNHLRYLNFSNTRITCVPEQVSDLFNLQSLLVSGCYELSALPESFVNLINLRHLDISRTPKLNKMPLGIGGLTSLQTLPKVVIERDNSFKISDLKDLSNLQGRLSIIGLDKVIDPPQANNANLDQKKGLDGLDMEWSDVFDDYRNEKIEYEVLDKLRPHHKLRNLRILFNKGKKFPQWVGDRSFDQLTELTLCGCRSTHLPTLEYLPSLEKLFVKRMNEVKIVDFEITSLSNNLPRVATFRCLKVLKFDDMQAWKRWFTSGGDDNGTKTPFPRLRELSIKRCPSLAQVSIGWIPSLRVLNVEGCSEQVLRSIINASSSLVALKMWNVNGLTQLHEQDFMDLGDVEDLCIEGRDKVRYLLDPETDTYKILRSFHKLEKLEVRNCDALESLNCPNHVERLVISCCGKMTSLTFSPLLDLLQLPSSITFSLKSLDIHGCENLTSFSHEHLQSFTSLEELFIRDCPSMNYSFPCGLWPPNLRSLGIGYLNKPMSEWGPQNFPTSLVELLLYGKNSGVVSFAVAEHASNTTTTTTTSCFLLPPSLTSLGLNGFLDVESLSEVLQHLPFLKSLHIWSCPKLRDLPETTSYLTVKVWL